MTPLMIETMTVEGRHNPLGIDERCPRFSWTLIGDGRNRRQTAYEIEVAGSDEDLLAGRSVWHSGRVPSSQSTWVPYGGPPLASRQRYYWRVRVYDESEHPSSWSPIGWWEMGLLTPRDWHASWIAAPPEYRQAVAAPAPSDLSEATRRLRPPLYLRKVVNVARPLKRARLYATARGVYVTSLNGARVGSRYLDPGWTDYRRRILYQTFDVTKQLHVGDNVLGAILGDGWFAGYVGFERQRHHYGDRPYFLAQLELWYDDGHFEIVGTDDTWTLNVGPIQYSDLLMGERYDARLDAEIAGWDRDPHFPQDAWTPAYVYTFDNTVEWQADPTDGIQVTETLEPVAVTERAPGVFLYDLGQNMVGFVRITVQGPAGDVVRVRHAEMLAPDGSLYTENLRSAEATDVYVLRGTGREETFEPHFTYHGFRYVEVTGPAGPPPKVVGAVLHTALPDAGAFRCDNPLVNQLQSNIRWSQRGNYISVPTDCPQRDERLGWLADAQIFARTATFNMDVFTFFRKWLADVRDAQGANGAFPDVAPRLVDLSDGAPAWGDAGVIIPWILYETYGDPRFLSDNYDAMARWIQYLTEANPDGIWRHRRWHDYGDWLAVGEETPKELLATAFYAHDVALLARAAEILGRRDDADRYRALFEHIRQAFQHAYVKPDGRVEGDTQTGYLLTLAMDLAPAELRAAMGERLVDNLRRHDWHLTTGFVGVRYLCPVLSEIGRSDVAYRLLLTTSYPSWGYTIAHGATTMWERWDGWTEERGFQTPSMNSFNHYAFGSIGEWLFRYAAGIDSDTGAPGFRQIRIRPQPTDRLAWVEASYRSVQGRIAVRWERSGRHWAFDVTIPVNTRATVSLPRGGPESRVLERGEPLDTRGFHRVDWSDRGVTVEIGSGEYRFLCEDVFPEA